MVGMTSRPESNESLGRDTGPTLAPLGGPTHTSALMLQEPSPEAPLPFGRYQLIRRIGAGGMGEVFLAREGGATPRAVVVKKILPNLAANRAFVGRFLDEAKVVVRLDHHNIARVYAMGDVNGEYFLSMEYVQGKTVSRFTKRLRKRRLDMPLGIVLLLGERICQGLQYAHEAKDEAGNTLHLVHRDLSPANVCISYQGDVKIIDFGAAQSTLKEEQTAPRVVIGNLTYMAPEQAKKQIVDGRADLYSCGVMLWELLSWHALPQKGDPIERWRKAANPVWEPPSAAQPTIPKDVDEVILKALRKEPKDRYATAGELAEALRELRQRHAPQVKDRDLGELLARVFAAEKAGEDWILHEAIYGQPVSLSPADKPKKVQIVPPTALAFEHSAAIASAEFARGQDITDPGGLPPPMGALDAGNTIPFGRAGLQKVVGDSKPRRTSFGVTIDEAQERADRPSLIQEIEASEDFIDEQSEPEAMTSTHRLAGWQMALLLLSIFLVATSLGFLGVWLSMS